MPRRLSEDTIHILFWLWYLPWASAADIARITGMNERMVSNVLSRRRKAGWLEVARIGRVLDVADRYVFSTAGVEAAHELYGWRIFWWHSANAVSALARRLEVVEMAYLYLPQLWQSNLVSERTCHVYRERPDVAWQTGQPVMRAELEETNWHLGKMVAFHWMEKKPFDVVVSYRDGRGSQDILHLPVLWKTNFQTPPEFQSVRREMREVFTEDKRWSRLTQAQALSPEYRPGMIIFTPDRVSGAMAQRNWLESLVRGNGTVAAVIDAQGQIVRAMSPPTAWCEGFYLPRHGLSLKEIKDVSRVVRPLVSGPYGAVNGVRAWRTFRAVDGSPGVKPKQVAEWLGVHTASLRVSPAVARRLLKKMVDTKVLAVRGRSKGHYLDVSGRGLLADSQRVTRARTNRRYGVYAEKDGVYLRLQTDHNQGQVDAILFLRRHGFLAYPTMGLIIEYWRNGKRFRVTPDAFVVLPPGILVAIEYERSATSDKDIKDKADKYLELQRIGCPIPVLFITETEEAAKKLAKLRYDYLLATSLEAVRKGPHGHAVIKDGINEGKPGCWWYWYSNQEKPTPNAPIDLGSQLYAADEKNKVWRVPLDQPFRRAKLSFRIEDGKFVPA